MNKRKNAVVAIALTVTILCASPVLPARPRMHTTTWTQVPKTAATIASPAQRAAFGNVATVIATTPPRTATATSPDDLEPPGSDDVLVTWPPGNRLPDIIIDNEIYTFRLQPLLEVPSNLGIPDYACWNGHRLLVGDGDALAVIDVANRRVLRVYDDVTAACWTQKGVLRVCQSPNGRQTIVDGAECIRVPRHMQITTVTTDGRWFLGWLPKLKGSDPFPYIAPALVRVDKDERLRYRRVKGSDLEASSKDPYGDQLMIGRFGIIINIDATGGKEKSCGQVVSVDRRTMRAHVCTSDACYMQAPMSVFGKHVIGVVRRVALTIGNANTSHYRSADPKYFRFDLAAGLVRIRRIPYECVGYAHSPDSNREAFIGIAGGRIITQLYSNGQLVDTATYLSRSARSRPTSVVVGWPYSVPDSKPSAHRSK
jgi:hypothetical protein